ncbi:MAG TPA: chemotaxis-specific protein-glutamate methyltransferase CheB [Anaeromyxobacter sp.]
MTRPAAADPAIRVLLVDDSASSRAVLARILEGSCGAAVMGTAANGEEALGEALRLAPDLILLDLEMPRMDGFTFLRLLMARRPTPVVVVSAQSRRSDVFKALELGALDFVAKPEDGGSLEAIGRALLEKCQLLRSLRIENLSAREEQTARSHAAAISEPAGVVAIGASTGGPQAIQRLLAALPGTLQAGIVVAQHMPERFTAAFAERLARTTPFSAQEAREGDVVAAGRVLVGPGGRMLEVVRDARGTLRAAVLPPEPARQPQHCPSVDRLFDSVARAVGRRVCGVVLTGMGQDGRAGAAAVKRAGGMVLAESAETAVVYGMPQAVAESGAADEILPLPALAVRVARFGSGG